MSATTTALMSNADSALLKLQQFNGLVNTVADHLWVIDRNGRYVIANPAFLRSRQLSLEQVIGQTPIEVFPAEFGAIYHQADLAEMASGLGSTREDQIFDAAHDDMRYFELVKTPIFDSQGICVGLAGIARDITARRHAELALERAYAELYELSIRDVLTPSFNRRHILNLAIKALDQGELALLVFDLDQFKQVNDRYGHAAGDAVLTEVCQTVNRHIGASDKLGQLGGEEFCVLLPNQSLDQAKQCAELLRERIATLRIVSHQTEICPTASFGVSSSVSVSINSEQGYSRLAILMRAADLALYRAKNAGRNRVVVAG